MAASTNEELAALVAKVGQVKRAALADNSRKQYENSIVRLLQFFY